MTVSHPSIPFRTACLLLAASLSACSSIDNFLGGDKLDYRSTGTKTPGLEVPPDLTQLARDTRYQPTGGTVSAAAFQAGAAAPAPAAATAAIAPAAVGELRIERAGNQRWLVAPTPAEQLWPLLQAFWKERGFVLVVDQADAGVMETDWAENRAKIPDSIIRRTLGRVLDTLYSSGERDKFRTRVERTPSGTEIYLSHRGMVEELVGQQKDSTTWTPRRADPQLEAEMLQRLMVKLGTKEEQAKLAVSSVAAPPARARIVDGQAATLQVDDGFERAWRRVGLALDRSGFTVEDRDRAQGLYFVRYVDPASAGKGEPGFFGKLFSFGGKKDGPTGPARYRVAVKGEGERSLVTVQSAQGAPESTETGKRIIGLLVEDLR